MQTGQHTNGAVVKTPQINISILTCRHQQVQMLHECRPQDGVVCTRNENIIFLIYIFTKIENLLFLNLVITGELEDN